MTRHSEFKWKSPERKTRLPPRRPLESLKYILSQFQTRRRGPSQLSRGDRNIIVLDVSRAHFHPKSRLPTEDSKTGHVGKLLRTLYGARDTANAWDQIFNNAEVAQGYEIGLSSSCLYCHREQDSHGWRHGDLSGV